MELGLCGPRSREMGSQSLLSPRETMGLVLVRGEVRNDTAKSETGSHHLVGFQPARMDRQSASIDGLS